MSASQPLAVWQLKLMLAFYRRQHSLVHDSYKKEKPIRMAAMETSTGDGGDGAGDDDGTSASWLHDRQLISEELLTTTTNRIQQWLLQWQKSEKVYVV